MHDRLQRAFPFLLFLVLFSWGGFTTLHFLGVPPHLSSLVSEASWQQLEDIHPSFLRGIAGILPMLRELGIRLMPFTAYGIFALLVFGALHAFPLLTGRREATLRLSPMRLFLLFICSLWLLTTILFYAHIPGVEQRTIPDLSSQTVTGNIDVYQENFSSLQKWGCLVPARTNDTSTFLYKGWCMQHAFFSHVLSPIGILLILLLDFFLLGNAILHLLRLKAPDPLLQSTLAVGAGAASLITLLWFLALFGFLTSWGAWFLILGIPLSLFRSAWSSLRALWRNHWHLSWRWTSPVPFLFLLILFFLTLNYLTVIRPFPIGWDDLGRYLNAPRQLADVHRIVPGMFALQWEYLTALGFLLFGSSSSFGAVIAQEINWLSGVLALFAIFACTRFLLGRRGGLLAAATLYTLPMVGHFSFTDMKTENALLAFGTWGILCTFLAFDEQDEKTRMHWLFLGGVLTAIGFATKITLAPALFMEGIILTFLFLGWTSGVGTILLSFAAFLYFGGLSLPTILERTTGFVFPHMQFVGMLLFSAMGLIVFFLPFVRSGKHILLRSFTKYCAALLFGFLLLSTPWMMRNMATQNRMSIATALQGRNTVTPWLGNTEVELADAPAGSRALPRALQIDLNHEQCRGTGGAEELGRYTGRREGINLYIRLPWRVLMNSDATGYYIMLSPLFLIVPLILLFPAFWKQKRLILLTIATGFSATLWIFTGNGVPWYGISMFIGLVILAEAFFKLTPDHPTRILSGILVTCALLFALSMRLVLFEIQSPMLAYAWGSESAAVRSERLAPHYALIAQAVTQLSENPDRPFLYRIGTSISYFIPRNLERMPTHDNQLDFFNCLNQEGNHTLTLQRLQALGFHSLLYDTRTTTIESDPQGTLHQKERRLLDFLSDPAVNVTAIVNAPEDGVIYVLLP